MKNPFHLLLLFSLMACFDPEPTPEPPPPEPEPFYRFSGLTFRDELGAPVGTPDTTDWTLTDGWEEWEAELFEENFSLGCPVPADLRLDAFPNPVAGPMMLFITKTDSVPTRLALRLVDERLNVRLDVDSSFADEVTLNLDILEPDTFRLYYKFIRGGCEWRGHGDILKE